MRPSTKAKQENLLDNAADLFFELGYEGTSLDQLIERCGGSKQTLYRYFGDKRGLLKAVVARFTEQIRPVFEFRLETGAPPRAQMVDFACKYRTIICSPELTRLFRLVISRANHDPELVSFFLDRTARYAQQSLMDYLTNLSRNGEIELTDIVLASDQFLGAIRGRGFIEALFIGYEEEASLCRRQAEYAVDRLLRGDAPEQRSEPAI
ncbi:TetR/AcrR family transcriptional regulator [Microbulbifer hainanensis]|uniref:TetR/AcrR family transcriptional regulator n=1 Tax=Microbulbifer hainanensis TaxID=2735675 RepID=UPI0018671EBD|nr:TetR/AcrR family transcriptional regulator [Microbulbifer hainanensis]